MKGTSRVRSWITSLNVRAVCFTTGMLAIWQLAAMLNLPSLRYLPAPWDIGASAGELVSEPTFLSNLGHTAAVSIAGWAVSLTAGLMIGIMVGASRHVWRWSMASIDVIRSVPAVTMVPAAAILFGLSSKMEFAVVVFGCFWPVLVSTAHGLHGVPTGLRDVSDTLRLDRATRLRTIDLPSASTDIIVGARIALTLALVLSVVSEIVANPRGLGYQIVFEQQALRPDRMFACLLAIGVLGLAFNSSVTGMIRILAPGLVVAAERR